MRRPASGCNTTCGRGTSRPGRAPGRSGRRAGRIPSLGLAGIREVGRAEPVGAPPPHVSGDAVKAEAVGREGVHRAGAPVIVLGDVIAAGNSPCQVLQRCSPFGVRCCAGESGLPSSLLENPLRPDGRHGPEALGEEPLETRLVEDGYAQLPCPLQLRAGLLAGEHVVGVLADGGGERAAGRF